MEKERKSEQAYIPQALTMLDNSSHNQHQWHCHALLVGNRNENHNRISVLIGYT